MAGFDPSIEVIKPDRDYTETVATRSRAKLRPETHELGYVVVKEGASGTGDCACHRRGASLRARRAAVRDDREGVNETHSWGIRFRATRHRVAQHPRRRHAVLVGQGMIEKCLPQMERHLRVGGRETRRSASDRGN